jgi:hypothetical protein
VRGSFTTAGAGRTRLNDEKLFHSSTNPLKRLKTAPLGGTFWQDKGHSFVEIT